MLKVKMACCLSEATWLTPPRELKNEGTFPLQLEPVTNLEISSILLPMHRLSEPLNLENESKAMTEQLTRSVYVTTEVTTFWMEISI